MGSVSPGANFTLEIQAYGTSYARNFPTAVQQVAPGQYQVDLRSLMGWSGVRSFYVGIWVGGGAGRSVDLDRIHVGGSTVSQSTRYIYGPGIDNIVLMQDPQGQNVSA